MNPPESGTKQNVDVSQESGCCGRFQFTEGFLLDTVTGELWQFNEAARALVAVPRVATGDAGQADHQLLMEHLKKASESYAQMLDATFRLMVG